MIPFLDLKAGVDELREDLDAAVKRFFDSGWYVLGKEVEAFEAEYAAFCEAAHCVGVGTGLDALILALRSLDIGAGDEVIVPSNTYIATWLAVTAVGAKIVPVEPHAGTFNLDASLLRDLVTSRTKAIMPVNLYGQPVAYQPISEVASEFGLKIVVDNAQAQGARYQGKRVGGIGDIECHSFYPSKNLGAYGEAGAITTNDARIAESIRMLRNYGSRERYKNEVCGVNSRLDAMQAALLRVKLAKLDEWNARRTLLANQYLRELAGLSTIQLPQVIDDAEPVWHLFVVRSPERDLLRSHLDQHAIGSLIHYPIPPHRSEAYAELNFPSGSYPIAEQLADTVLSLPMGPHLGSEQVSQVCEAIRGFRPGSDNA